MSVVEGCQGTDAQRALAFCAFDLRRVCHVPILLAWLQVVSKTLEAQHIGNLPTDIRLDTICFQGVLRGGPKAVCSGIVCQGLETAIAAGRLKDCGDGQLLACQLPVKLVFHNAAVGLTTDKERVALGHVADALLVAVRLVAGDERVGTYLFDIACGFVDTDCHKMKTGSPCLVVDDGIAVTAQPRNATIVPWGNGLGKAVLLVNCDLLGRNLQCKQAYQDGKEASFHNKMYFFCKSTK